MTERTQVFGSGVQNDSAGSGGDVGMSSLMSTMGGHLATGAGETDGGSGSTMKKMSKKDKIKNFFMKGGSTTNTSK